MNTPKVGRTRKAKAYKAANLNPYTMRRTRIAFVEIIGPLWMPATMGATRYRLSDYDLENIGTFDREHVEQWLCSHAGDFQSVKDFHAVCGAAEIAWADEESEMTFCDCMEASPFTED